MNDLVLRKALPNLNTFCSNDSTELIKWLNSRKIRTFDWVNEPIASKYICECPNIEFVIDGYREMFYHTPEFDRFVEHMLFDVLDRAPEVKHHREKIMQFYDYQQIDKKERGRIIVWAMSHILLETVSFPADVTNKFTHVRYMIALNMHQYNYQRMKAKNG